MDDLIDQLRDDLAARLRADEILAGIEVVTERSGDPLEQAAVSLGLMAGSPGRRGLCLVVLQMSARPETVEIPNPVLILQPIIRVLENPVLNETGMTSLTVARRVLQVLHHYQPAGLASCLVADSPAIIAAEDALAPLAYDTAFRCMEGDSEAVQRVPAPAIWPEEGVPTSDAPISVTIGCEDPSATILYTADGTPPYRGNGSAIQYAGPFNVDGPCLIRAAAWRTGYITSDTVAARFDPAD